MPTYCRRGWRLLVAAALLLLLLLTACGTAPPQGPTALPLQKVRFTEVIHSIFYAPQYIAQAKGFFQDAGIDLDTSTAQGSDKGAAALLAGTADIALVGPETTVFIYNQDGPTKVRLFAQLTNKDGSFLVARKGAPDFSWKGLTGKTIIGWRVGSMPQMVANALLRQHDLTPGKDVTYISNLAAPAMAGAFQSGQGDYLQAYEPLASQLEQAGQGRVVVSVGAAYGAMPVTGYIATDAYLATHADVVQRYTTAIYRAMRYLDTASPDTVAQEIAPYFTGTDVKLLAAAIARYKTQETWKHSPVMNPEDLAKLQNLLVASGVLALGQEAPFDKIAINRFAQEAVAAIK